MHVFQRPIYAYVPEAITQILCVFNASVYYAPQLYYPYKQSTTGYEVLMLRVQKVTYPARLFYSVRNTNSCVMDEGQSIYAKVVERRCTPHQLEI